jgi:hypothetical protein
LAFCLGIESIVPMNPPLTGPCCDPRRTAKNETIAAIHAARAETSLI